MPHCIVEYSQTLESRISPSVLVETVHQAALASALFEVTHIKTRALAYAHYQSGSAQADFIHVTIRLHAGRTVEQKKHLSSLVLKHLTSIELSAVTITIETVDMDSASYAKQVVY